MNTINLIDPSKSDIRFTTMIFPDGQPHIKIDVESLLVLDHSAPARIFTRLSSANDLMLALFIKNTLDYQGFEKVELHVTYLMAARMDRVMLAGEPFSLKVIASILNNANFHRIFIFDPHSEVSTALIDKSYAVTNHQYVKDCLDDYFKKSGACNYCLVSPDAGALKKIHKLAQALGVEDVVECMKERDLKTGALTKFTTVASSLQGKTCFIVDDICDGGGTFIGTAKMLKEKGAQKVVLIVSHGIFGKGTSLENVDAVYTTNSFREVPDVVQMPIDNYL
ncbi:MAG: ribose-phosphate pyrophosphokinase [Chitinophagaceae bacterium]|nr:MAG: ribose-phosphate pyrophosphokinase [Chitinophagaceae bacterium]